MKDKKIIIRSARSRFSLKQFMNFPFARHLIEAHAGATIKAKFAYYFRKARKLSVVFNGADTSRSEGKIEAN